MELMRFLKKAQHRKRRVKARVLFLGSGKRETLPGRPRKSQETGVSGKQESALVPDEKHIRRSWEEEHFLELHKMETEVDRPQDLATWS